MMRIDTSTQCNTKKEFIFDITPATQILTLLMFHIFAQNEDCGFCPPSLRMKAH